MKKISTRFYPLQAAVIATFLMVGCTASMHVMNDGEKLYPATSPEKVLIVSDRSSITKEYTELGYVAIEITNDTQGDQLKSALREAAASIGADAVVNFRIFGRTAGGIAVRYK